VRVTLLAPAYNEAPVIEAFVRAVAPRLGPDCGLLVVDDGSTDGTGDILRRLAAEVAMLDVVSHETNRGLGAALATGFAAADGDVVVTMDADLSHPLDLIDDLVARSSSADAVHASRFVPGGGMVGVPAHRVLISRWANRALRVALHVPVRDLTTGMRAYRRSVIRDLPIVSSGFEAQLEITARLATAGCTLAEVPLVLGTRAAGESKMSYLRMMPRYVRAVLMLLRLRWLR
jgi:dolichol-phosphate mannosyltransferase